ncbi:hypothetical protein HanXRQr2_Chr04g0164551 [Helianthus annuus]|uniref:Uncharacterized protein n=1 Tax=Helianthus annuus TaxID=4232 RepID=A0A9K3J888_HELAN|nr:hypothetical protein HanXRQr2_Chr04g0164551 [Helianthus annuus]KAJ0931172.1 hypothetical protein HanPSC8_Chr04g0158441 [Helianthus annuus]
MEHRPCVVATVDVLLACDDQSTRNTLELSLDYWNGRLTRHTWLEEPRSTKKEEIY